jgi:hypothetical protein
MDGTKARSNPLTARQIPGAPKCARDSCPYLYHADPANNGGTHCCKRCKDEGEGSHGDCCHKLLLS